jgi:hypothetical protein
MFNSFATRVLGLGVKKDEEQAQQQRDHEQKESTYNYPKSEPNLPSAFVFPREEDATSGKTEKGK